MSLRAPKLAILSVGIFLASIAGCPPTDPGGGGGTGNTTNPVLGSFTSEREFLEYFKQQAQQRTNSTRGLFGALADFATNESAPTPGAPQADGAAAGAADDSGGDFTTTNIQEAGVDESDVFKSDGTFLYIAKYSSLRVVKAAPRGELAEVARFDLPDENVRFDSMYLLDGRLILIAQSYSFGTRPGGIEPAIGAPVADSMIWPPYYAESAAILYEIDIANPAAPALLRRVEMDGTVASSRLTNNRLILIVSIVPELPPNPTPLAIQGLTADAVLPVVRSGQGEARLVDWTEIYRPDPADGYFMTAVITLDAANIENRIAAAAIIGNSSTIYASTEAVYVTDADYDPNDNYRERTAIHKFSFGQNGEAVYAASGSIPGRLLNQFSLSEHEGHLRTATHVANTELFIGDGVVGIGVGTDPAPPNASTVDSAEAEEGETDPGGSGGTVEPDQPVAPPQPPPNTSYNALFVLGQNGDRLEIVGKVENIAPGEQLYSARFMADRGFLVTFFQIDPLFALDLSVPTNPRVVGELKVPGFSDYLHPLGENHLIGVGRATEESQWGGQIPDAVQLSLFDVTDLANPRLVQQLEIGGPYSSTDVSYTHKAFTLTEDGLLAIPAQLNPDVQDPFAFDWKGPDFDGLLIYRVSTSGFESVGRLPSVVRQTEYGYSWTEWRRSAFIGQDVYVVTPAGVRAASVTNLADANTVTLAPGPEDQ